LVLWWVGGLDPGCGVGRYHVSQVLPFSVEVRDNLLLLLVVGFCLGPVFAVIVGVYRGADVYMVPLWYHSIVWAHVVQLPVYAWVSCSSQPWYVWGSLCSLWMYWYVDTLVPSLFLGCRIFLFGVLYVKALYVCVCDVPYLFVYIVKHKL